MSAYFDKDGITVYHGDNRDVLKQIPDNSIDAVVTDPPSGVAFMGQDWDSFSEKELNPSGQQTDIWADNKGKNPFARSATPRYQGKTKLSLLPFQDFIAEVFTEVYRVLKPGGHAAVWALPRTSHHTAMGLERSGFELRDVLSHIFSTGFPKSLNIAKTIDKLRRGHPQGTYDPESANHGKYIPNAKGVGAGASRFLSDPKDFARDDEGSFHPDAQQWSGWGTALKPAVEHWLLVRKPIDSTIIENVLKYGTGGLNIDATRVGWQNDSDKERGRPSSFGKAHDGFEGKAFAIADRSHRDPEKEQHPAGRFPPNLILSHSADCERVGKKKVPTSMATEPEGRPMKRAIYGATNALGRDVGYGDADGMEVIDDWSCAPGCPVAELDQQSGDCSSPWIGNPNTGAKGGKTFGGTEQTIDEKPEYRDTGGASRFFSVFTPAYNFPFKYTPKPATSEREAGIDKTIQLTEGQLEAGKPVPEEITKQLEQRLNIHPTVKSISLMKWLCRLITPPGGLILDPFLGSGSTAVAAIYEDFRCIGIERENDYIEIAKGRIENAHKQYKEEHKAKYAQGDLFAGFLKTK